MKLDLDAIERDWASISRFPDGACERVPALVAELRAARAEVERLREIANAFSGAARNDARKIKWLTELQAKYEQALRGEDEAAIRAGGHVLSSVSRAPLESQARAVLRAAGRALGVVEENSREPKRNMLGQAMRCQGCGTVATRTCTACDSALCTVCDSGTTCSTHGGFEEEK